jgi:LuxR family maltose regulon positive regulatory protein
MTTTLLTTKLHIPAPRPDLVPRPRLSAQVDDGLQLGHKLTLVSAPAGFGKTTLLSEWAVQSQWPIACLTSRWRLKK